MSENQQIQIDQVIRSRRRSLSLQVTDEGKVIARIPLRASLRTLEHFVRHHRGWIVAKQTEAKRKLSLISKRAYQPGERFLYLGVSYPLRHLAEAPQPLFFDPVGIFHLRQDCQPHAESHFTDWYRGAAQTHITERVAAYAHRYGQNVANVRISNAKQRWGSCSNKGNLNFSWRLLMAPRAVVDYVIVHELAHLDELNHSKKFWERVAQMQPEFAQQQGWLHNNEQLLRL